MLKTTKLVKNFVWGVATYLKNLMQKHWLDKRVTSIYTMKVPSKEKREWITVDNIFESGCHLFET